jgi:hypothetical protein
VLPNPPGSDYVEIGELSFPPYIAASNQGQYKNPYALAADLRPNICAVGGDTLVTERNAAGVIAADLRPNICAVGGDTLVTERNAAGVIVRGTVYRHADVLDVAPPPPPPSRAEGCEPGCGPGSLCEAGTCVPRQCVPACGDGAACGTDGLCHPNE